MHILIPWVWEGACDSALGPAPGPALSHEGVVNSEGRQAGFKS